jgi:hypothetical protein
MATSAGALLRVAPCGLRLPEWRAAAYRRPNRADKIIRHGPIGGRSDERIEDGCSVGSAVPARAVWALGFVSLFAHVSSEMIHGLLPTFLAAWE